MKLSIYTCLLPFTFSFSKFLSIDIFLNLAFPFQNEVSDLMYNWVAQRPDFKSAVRVVKMVLNTQCYQYLWLTMWFHAKKSKETLKNSKSLILQCKFGSRAQKWPKIAKKTDHSIAIYSIFCIGMVYFGCLQVNPHIQAVQNMCSKGG